MLDTGSEKLIPYIVKVTLADQTLLDQLDLTNPTWSTIWLAHIRAGGQVWPPNLNRQILASQLIDQILQLNAPADLLNILQPVSSAVLVRHPRRADVWSVLPTGFQQDILQATALLFLNDSDPLLFAKTPEQIFTSEIMRAANGRRLSDLAIAGILAWQVQIPENAGIDWLQPGHLGRFANEIG